MTHAATFGYAKTCEEKLAVMIEELKKEIAAEKIRYNKLRKLNRAKK